jgi:hypothetical protein
LTRAELAVAECLQPSEKRHAGVAAGHDGLRYTEHGRVLASHWHASGQTCPRSSDFVAPGCSANRLDRHMLLRSGDRMSMPPRLLATIVARANWCKRSWPLGLPRRTPRASITRARARRRSGRARGGRELPIDDSCHSIRDVQPLAYPRFGALVPRGEASRSSVRTPLRGRRAASVAPAQRAPM